MRLKVLLVVLLFGKMVHPAMAAIWFVNQAASGQNQGTSWEDAFWDLQDALDFAQSGDEIWVAVGTYKPDRGTGDRTMAFELPCGVALYGGFAGTEECLDDRQVPGNETILSGDLNNDDGPWNCPEVSSCCAYEYQGFGCDDPECQAIVCGYRPECCATEDPEYWHNYCAPLAWFACCHLGTWGTCEDSYRTMSIHECDGAIIDGVVVVGGYHDWVRDGEIFYPVNGSIVSQDAVFTVSRSTFRGHATSGLFAQSGSHVVLSDCLFQSRSAKVWGGVIEETRSSVTVDGCRFQSAVLDADHADAIMRNSSFVGDGSSADVTSANATVDSCEFRDTGGLNLFDGHFTVSNSTFLSAGRISLHSASAMIDNCAFVGGMGRAVSGGPGSILVNNCVFLDNANSAIVWSSGNLNVLNCTIMGNGFENFPGGIVGGAIYLQHDVSAQILNSILWGNGWGHANLEDNQIVVRPEFDEALEVDNSIIEGWSGMLGGPGNTGNSGVDPMLADPDGPDDILGTEDDDVRLLPGSPLINGGFPSAYLLPTDLDGHARVLCGAVDIGAYEFGAGDFNCDQSVDLSDQSAWGNCMTGPLDHSLPPLGNGGDGCEAFDFNADSDIDLADFAYLQRVFVCP